MPQDEIKKRKKPKTLYVKPVSAPEVKKEDAKKKRAYNNANIHIKYNKSKTIKPITAFFVDANILKAAHRLGFHERMPKPMEEVILRLDKEGATPIQIADLMQFPYDKVRNTLLRLRPKAPKKKRTRACSVSREQVESLRVKSEYSAVVIARKLKCSRSSVHKILADLSSRKPLFRKKHEELQKRERRGEFECVPITGRYYYAFPKGSSRMHAFPADSNFLYSICGLGVVDVETRKTGRRPIPELLCVICAKKEAK